MNLSRHSETDEWRKAPSGQRRPVVREYRDDLDLEVGQIWKHKPDSWLYPKGYRIKIERIARRTVFAKVLHDTLFPGLRRQVSFLDLRANWEREQ